MVNLKKRARKTDIIFYVISGGTQLSVEVQYLTTVEMQSKAWTVSEKCNIYMDTSCL